MVALILMALILTALWKVFLSSQKNAKEIIENHAINDEIDRILIRIIDDVREANSIATYPIPIDKSEVDGLLTRESDPDNDSNNKLTFFKINYDFTKKPNELAENEVNYTTNLVTYYIEPNDGDPTRWSLFRKMIPLGKDKQPIEGDISLYELPFVFDECVFYRIKNPDLPRTGNVYIKFKFGRKEENKYSNEIIICVKERGAMPDS